jgi:threonyl-tRNA synthetase
MVCRHADTGYEEQYYLRPMNCPHHHMIYKSAQRSYRDLPLRLAEYGATFRYEQSGELSGLLRVRGMTLNDAHLYVRMDQVEEEVQSILKLYNEMYECMKIRNYSFRLSLRSPGETKYRGTDEMWDKAEKILESILEKNGAPYYKGVGEAAFYGPKIDIQFKYLLGREETFSTIQLDFLAPETFDMTYIDDQGKPQRPVVIHRAPFSTHERFVSYILEYYGGVFPTWLSPVQLVLIPVNESCHEYCQSMVSELTRNMVRAELDISQQSFGKKIRTHTVRKVPILLIIGNQEVDQAQVTVRRYGVEKQETLAKDVFIEQLYKEIRDRVNTREPLSSIV